MAAACQLKLGAFMRSVSTHTAAWRYPDDNFNFTHLKQFAQMPERAKFDALFMLAISPYSTCRLRYGNAAIP